MVSLRSVVVLLATSTFASATFPLRWEKNWSVSSWNNAPKDERDDCSYRGGFYIKGTSNHEYCCSDRTRITPRDVHCPLGWSQHKRTNICIPPKPNYTCDCREGYTWNGNSWKCEKNESPKCGRGYWWHKRSGECLPDQPSSPGKCPTGKTCPSGWQWDNHSAQCVPKNCEAPEPDCHNWDETGQCCQNKPTPSPKSGNGGYGSGYGTNRKRDLTGVKARLQMVDQSQRDDIDETFCPAPLKACAVMESQAATSPEWAYECVDTENEIDSCGGCASEGTGVDCSALSGVKSVGCEKGGCKVFRCFGGYTNTGSSCVKA